MLSPLSTGMGDRVWLRLPKLFKLLLLEIIIRNYQKLLA